MASTIIEYVDLASDVVSFITSVEVDYARPDLKDKILNAPKDSFLKVTKKIGSSNTILDVVLIDDDYIKRAVLGG